VLACWERTEWLFGLGIVIDTYDNDNTGLHPLLVAIVNDGTKKYTHQHHHQEGASPVQMEVGNCQLPIRNLGGTSAIKVTYRNNQLKVETQLFGTTTFVDCLVANSIELPAKYHFGFSSATGQLADNHDVYGFSVRNLDANALAIDSQRIYSAYDKYQVADYLSKIYYQVSLNPSPSSGTAAVTQYHPTAAFDDSTLTRKMDTLSALVTTVEEEVKAIAQAVKVVEGKVGLLPKELSELSNVRNSLQQLANRLGNMASSNTNNDAAEQQQQPQPQQPQPQQQQQQGIRIPQQHFQLQSSSSSSSSTVWTILSYVLGFIAFVAVVGGIYVVYNVIKIRNERSKKFF